MPVKLIPQTNRIIGRLLIYLLPLALLLIISCSKDKTSVTQKEQEAAADQDYLKNAGAEWDSLFNAGNATGLAALYAENIIYMPFNAPTIYERQALQVGFEKFFTDYIAEHRTSIDEILTGENWAIERAHYLLTYTSKTSGNVTVETGRQVVCRKKIEGKWQIAWEIWNTDKRPEQ